MSIGPESSAETIAAAVRTGKTTASAVVRTTLARIERLDGGLGGFTAVTAERAIRRAAEIDGAIAAGRAVGPLAGVPFAVKNLFDIRGLPTLAGSKINRERAAATDDAALIERLEAAGAILVGALNMGEYAYDFTGENAHDGPSLNPHDRTRMAGGSSGGSGTAIAAGMVPLALGSDTNGSIRVPSSFCGIFGLKPTYGRLTRTGTFPFVTSLDHLGPFARSVGDLATAYDLMQGPDAHDPACAQRPIEPTRPGLEQGLNGLRIARAVGWFDRMATDPARIAVRLVATALGAEATVELPEVERARAAAYLITGSESAALHLERLRQRPMDFDPDVRDRLIAGAMITGAWVQQAQKLRRWYRDAVLRLFDRYDVILAPATPCTAPKSGQKTLELAGKTLPLRPNIGVLTQPVSFIGLPVVAVPIWRADGHLPIGVQIITAPWREDIGLRVAAALESAGVAQAPVAG